MTKVGCSSCAKRREKLKCLREKKKAKDQGLQAAAIGAVLAVTEAAGKVLGIGEDTEDADASGTDDSGSEGA